MNNLITYDEKLTMQHHSHAQQIANFTFSAMLGIMVLMLVGLLTSEVPLVMENGFPKVDFLVIPANILGGLAILSSVSRLIIMRQGIQEHWGQNQAQFLISTIIGIYFLTVWLVF